MAKIDRANFGSKLGVILASAGSAVGLGNIWRFPYETGNHGGADRSQQNSAKRRDPFSKF